MSYTNITPAQVKAKLDEGIARLIDVRELQEHAIARIEGAELMPLSRHPDWVAILPKDGELIIMCHHGGRSAQIAEYLTDHLGHANVANMAGGIDAWSTTVDATVPQY